VWKRGFILLFKKGFEQMIEVYPVGTIIKIGGDIDATIVGINIRQNNNIAYEIAYYDAGIRQEHWVYDLEIKSDANKIVLGFKAN
jgi:hypothetical protein